MLKLGVIFHDASGPRASARQARPGQARPGERSSGNQRFRGSFRRRKSKQTRLNLSRGKQVARIKSGARATIRHMLSPLPSNRVFVSICSRVHLPSITLLFSLFSSNNTSGRNNGLSDFGKGRDTAAGIVPPFYQRNYFYALLPNPPLHRTHFNISRWPGPSSPIPRSSRDSPSLPDLIQFPR